MAKIGMVGSSRFIQALVIAVTTFLVTGCPGSGGGGSTPSPTTYSVSGTITTLSNNVVDSDVNDPNAPYTTNDTAGNAQGLPNPAAVGGVCQCSGYRRSVWLW